MNIVLRLRSGTFVGQVESPYAIVHTCELPSPLPDIIERPEGKFWVRAGIADGCATYLDATLVRLEAEC